MTIKIYRTFTIFRQKKRPILMLRLGQTGMLFVLYFDNVRDLAFTTMLIETKYYEQYIADKDHDCER